MSDSKEEVFRCLAEYQNVKIYTSNIVDIVIVALATVANITIFAYYLDGITVKNLVFKPTRKQISIAINKACFINDHYELIVNATAQAELEYESVMSPSIETHLAVVRELPTKKFLPKCVNEKSSTERCS